MSALAGAYVETEGITERKGFSASKLFSAAPTASLTGNLTKKIKMT